MTRTILLADDSVTIQKVIELTFMEEDYEVVSAGDGDEALERLEEITPDFVIADVHMPGASGIDVCRRSKELHPGVPVLLLVGTFEPFDEAAAQAAGADAHLKKPFDSQELIQLVGDLMAMPDAEETGEAEPAAEPPGGQETDDTWGFGAAAAELQAVEEAPSVGDAEPGPPAEAGDEPVDLDWAGPLEPLPEEEAPAATGQAEEPAPTWVRPTEAASAARAGGEPFHLGAVERADRGDEVFDLRDDDAGETAEQVPERAAAEPAAGAPPEDRSGADRWGFAMEEPAEEPEAAAAADTGWEEVEEPSAGVGDVAWGEPEAEARAAEPPWGGPEDEEEPEPSAAPAAPAGSEPGRVAAPPPDRHGEDTESEVSAPPPDWDGEAESQEARGWAPPPDWDGEAESQEARVSAPPPDWDGEAESEAAAPPPDWDGEDEAAAAEPAEEWAAGDAGVAEPVPGSGAAYGGAAVSVPGPAAGYTPPPDEAEAGAAAAAGAGSASASGLSEQDVDRIARRVAELLGERVTREVAWEVVPDLAEVVIRERLRELEGQID